MQRVMTLTTYDGTSLRRSPPKRIPATLPRVVTIVACIATLAALGAPLFACDTPIYQYTMLYWVRDPYYVIHFHSAETEGANAELNEHLRTLSRGGERNANIAFTAIAVDDPDLVMPPVLKRIWSAHENDRLPFYAVLSPRGDEVYTGRLDKAAVSQLIDSPKRRELAKLLCDQKRGVALVLLGPDDDENKKAVGVVKGVAQRAKAADFEFGVLEVKRDDPAEAWFIRQLLAIESDLIEFSEPMVFGVFGRGHFLPPFLGRGINEMNMEDLAAFMNGPCTCEIKTSSLGMDYISDWDWDHHIADWPETLDAPPNEGFMIFDIDEGQAPADPDAPPIAVAEATVDSGVLPQATDEHEVAIPSYAHTTSYVHTASYIHTTSYVRTGQVTVAEPAPEEVEPTHAPEPETHQAHSAPPPQHGPLPGVHLPPVELTTPTPSVDADDGPVAPPAVFAGPRPLAGPSVDTEVADMGEGPVVRSGMVLPPTSRQRRSRGPDLAAMTSAPMEPPALPQSRSLGRSVGMGIGLVGTIGAVAVVGVGCVLARRRRES